MRKNTFMFYFVMVVFSLLFCNASAQTVLSPGDIVLVSVNSDGNDNFDLIPLVDITAGTVIYVTDNAWNGTALTTNEGVVTYTASSAVSKGSVISFSGTAGGEWAKSTNYAVSASGDNLLVYQGSASTPTMLYGVGWALATPWITTGTVNTNNSYIPGTLSATANTIVTLGSLDNYQYNTTKGTSGTVAEILALVANAANWNSNDASAYAALTTNFVVSSNSATAAPTFSVLAGTYTTNQSITLTSTTSNAKIYYTLDGSTPDNTKTLYSTAIALNTTATTTIKAIAYDSNDANPSSVTSATYVINLDPSITVGSASVPALYAQVGNTDTEIINVSGSNLTADISLAITGTNANQFSLSAATLTQTAGAVASSPITITYTPTAAGSHTATLTLSSTGAADKVFELTATAIWPPLTTPVASAATTVNNGGFTANWALVSGATQYDVNVYTKSGTKLIENFDTYTTTVPTDWTFNSMAYYSSGSTGYFGAGANSLKFDATNDSIMSPTYAQPATAISFWLRGASTDANSALLFQGSTNGSNWVTIEDIKPIPTTATVKLYNSVSTPALASGYIKFRLKYTKSAGNTAFDDFTYMNNYVDVPVAGSPFTVNDPEVTKQVSGLSPETTYYYTVVAKNTNVTSSVSNEISVTTSSVTGVEDPALQSSVYAANGNIVLTAAAGQKVEIFNSVGQRLLNVTAVEGVNTIPVNAKGVVIVKAGNTLTKVVL